ncbi:hypothetical protein AMES_6099 [Amycolatopsis mediterranei S699]|uniref:Uncharacterized protein n=2 Tax=Amycolatopsis mediterranei TaxID=33910 RepID=A0A0H3DE71_AMYMU|nr:hypothetical protein AMED_6189 [Amycolatopsis mediterranei U32]AEK44823.1 hypothetical protein RAM_31750 [Amycolatopsis mediterranei S699]AGT86763.1 hypothetical protein B737_6099 [Amycolatopsis mediterranei RB]KDO10745.1 hypothetical protein DV26_11000 [Amycolatopsis mediterranei]AFO79635.1 hypothetical protein AMES_6099 [Amycolatopsis mediterranei S699]
MPFNPKQPRGPDGRWIKTGGVFGAAVLATVVAAASGGDVVTSVGAGLDAATTKSVSEADAAAGKKAARKGDRAEAWRRLALKELKKEIKKDLRCTVQSFGQVQQFFLRHPCDKLDQLLFVVQDRNGNTIAGSVAWVKMPSAESAGQLRKLEDVYGSGDVTPFGSEVLAAGGFRFTGKHYRSRPDGKLVVIAETDPIKGHPSDAFLKQVADVADVLPPP